MKRTSVHILILLTISFIVFGFKLGERDFWGRHGEARRAEVSREMVASGDWLVPHLNGEPFVTKPPLYYWAAALAFTITGKFDELSARLPSIISAILGVFVTYVWGWRLFSKRAGWFAGLILTTSFLYAGMARTAGVDMMLTLFTTASLCCFTLGYQRRTRTYLLLGKQWNAAILWYLLSWICVALGTLTKNPIGIAVPLLAIAGFIVFTRDWRFVMQAKPWWGLLLFLLILLPWLILVYQRVPNFFEILYQETLGRYTDPEGTPHLEPWYYYIPALGAFAPWVIFLPGVIMSFFSKRIRPVSQSSHFLLIAFLTTFFLFSSVGSKREYYLLPLYPILALLVAKFWDDYVTMKFETAKRWTWKTMDIPLLGFAASLCLVGFAIPIGVKLYLPSHYLWLSLGFEVLLLATGIGLLITFLRGQAGKAFGIFVTATVLIYMFALTVIVPEMDRYRSRKEFFHEAASIIETHPIVDYNYEGFAPQFYLQRIIPVLLTINELQELLEKDEPTFVIMTGGHYKKLQRDHPELLGQFQVILDRVWTSATNPRKQKRLLLLKTSVAVTDHE